MRLSEAIRLGAMCAPQSRVGRPGMCALQAGLYAQTGIRFSGVCWTSAKRHWPWLNEQFICPATGELRHGDVLIMSLNDWHGFTREAIADFIETIEPQEDSYDRHRGELEGEKEREAQAECVSTQYGATADHR